MARTHDSGTAREAVLLRKLVHPLALRKQSGGDGSASSSTRLGDLDTLAALSGTARAWGFAGGRIDADALEAALAATLTDLPVLAGRLSGMKKLRLGSLEVAHSGRGALLVVVERHGTTVDQAMHPSAWPLSGLTASNQQLPHYLEPVELGRKLLSGGAPLMAVKLTRLADGDVLGICLCHALLDGMRWPGLAAHLAARYRQAVGGPPAEVGELLQPCDRRVLSLERYSREAGLEGWRVPEPARVRGSLAGYWRAAVGLFRRARTANQLALLHVPREALAALKAAAAVGNPAVTTGDVVQAAAALVIHAAQARPLLPVAPQAMAVMVQLPTPKDFFGNAVRMLSVSLPAGTEQPGPGDAAAALRALAGAIRQATLRFRGDKEEVALALAEAAELAGAPTPRMLCHVFSRFLPRMQSATNYVPTQQSLELWGLGPATHAHPLSYPRAADMAVIRPSAAPYSPGLFIQFVLPPAAMARLRAAPLLAALLPTASWVGGAAGS